MPAGQMVGPGPVVTAWRGRFAGRNLPIKQCVPYVPPIVPELVFPELWRQMPAPSGGYVGPVMAAALLAQGHTMQYENGVMRIGGVAALIGSAGKVFSFASVGSMSAWGAIAALRCRREVELSQGMTPENLAAWLLKKRAVLEKAAKNRIDAAARQSDMAIAAALIDDASFALAKWSHYA